MIINVGQRTDIPAFYSDWFYRRIKEGFVQVRNPFYPKLVTEYRLDPEVVDILSFCTKNPAPMLSRLDELKQFRQWWYVSITPYGKDLEAGVPDKRQVIESFKKLSDKIGSDHIGWRYDPILIHGKYTVSYHIRAFEKMCSLLEGYTHLCVFSFLDLYQKTKKNLPGARKVTREEQEEIAKAFFAISSKHNIVLNGCHEDRFLEKYGIQMGGCLTKEFFEKQLHVRLETPKGYVPPREGCACLLSNDIGAYQSCLHRCLYCYVTYDHDKAISNYRLHDPYSPMLIGHLEEGDLLRKASQESYLASQLSLF